MASFIKKVWKQTRHQDTDPQHVAPNQPPSPDLTNLSPNELAILNSVFQRQEEFEREEALRLKKLEEQLDNIEERIKLNGSFKRRLKSLDVRLCRLCFQTKFANGIGRVCHDCHNRVCFQCGTFSRPRWNERRNRSVRGRWRCNVCQLKRDVKCKSGSWYYGNEYKTTIENLRHRVTSTLEASSSDAGSSIYFGRRFDLVQRSPKSDPELGGAYNRQSLASCRGRRRQSLPSYKHNGASEEDPDDDSTDGEAFKRERQMLWQKRYERRKRKSLGKHTTTEVNYDGENCVTSFDRRLDSRYPKVPAVDPHYQSPSKEHNGVVREKLFRRRFSDQPVPSDGSTSGTQSPRYVKKSNEFSKKHSSVKFQRRSSSRDIVHRDFSTHVSEPKTNVRDTQPDPNSLDSNEKKTRTGKPYAQFFHSPSDTELGITSRKKSIRLSEGVHHRRGRERIEVVLHRDKSDLNCKTNGLGMKVIGGRMCKDGQLGTFVTNVIVGGPADLQGALCIGDQILKWNSIPMVGLTFEEAMKVTQQSGDSVRLEIMPGEDAGDDKTPSEEKKPMVKSKSDNYIQQKGVGSSEAKPEKPRRRLLPKTPIEMKKVSRHITGRIQMLLYHDLQNNHLIVDVISADCLLKHGREDPIAIVMCSLLPQRSEGPSFQTEAKYASTCPKWKEEFCFENFFLEDLAEKSLEITIWNARITEEDFIGEVLLDLKDAKLDNKPLWYTLEDHDENSSPLPFRKTSVCSSSGVSTNLSSSMTWDSIGSVPNPNNLSPVPTNEKQKRPHSLTRLSPRSTSSTRTLGTKSSCDSATDRESHSPIQGFFRRASRSNHHGSKDGIIGMSRRISRSYSTSSFPVSDSDDSVSCEPPDRLTPEGDDITSLLGPGQVHPRPSFGDRCRSNLVPYSSRGYTAVRSKRHPYKVGCMKDMSPDWLVGRRLMAFKEKMVYGDIKLGFMVSKGQLEVDVICVNGLTKSGAPNPPDCYVKTYLMEDNKMIQKKKTNMIKGTYDPIYRRKIKYSACNIHGRFIKINIWERRKGLDKKQCLGEAIVKLDSLQLSEHTMAWYKLFQINATDHIYF